MRLLGITDRDLNSAVVARAPLVNLIERSDVHATRQIVRCEDEIELSRRRRRCLFGRVIGRHVQALSGELAWPWRRLTPPRRLRSDERQADRGEALEDGAVPRGPIRTPMLAVPEEAIEITGGDDAMTSFSTDEAGNVGSQPVCGRISKYPATLR